MSGLHLPRSDSEDLTGTFLQELKSEPEWHPPAAQRQVTEVPPDPVKLETSSVKFSLPTSSHTFANVETVSQLRFEGCGLSLGDLPPEAMHRIYRFLVHDPSIKLEVHAFLDVFKVTRIAHVSRALRDEYLAFLLENFAFKTDLKWLP